MFLDDELDMVFDNYYKQLLYSFRPLDTPSHGNNGKNSTSAGANGGGNTGKKGKGDPGVGAAVRFEQFAVDPQLNMSWDEIDDHFDFTLAPIGGMFMIFWW